MRTPVTDNSADPLPLLVVTHVPWEGPHRLLDSCGGLTVVHVAGLAGDARLPDVHQVSGAVFMGGPMSANDIVAHPGLAHEIAWLQLATVRDVPVLGICLGAQLLARALGARVAASDVPEIGWSAVEVLDATDPVIGPLAPSTTVLHWHGEVFDLPVAARPLARSAQTRCQAFRAGASAWGLLFHPEADGELIEQWLAVPAMAREAAEALGSDYRQNLRRGAIGAEGELVPRATRSFEAFARRCSEHSKRCLTGLGARRAAV